MKLDMGTEYLKELYKMKNAKWEEVNLFGIRDESGAEKDEFNDIIGIATDFIIKMYQGTTDPSVYWTKHPITHKGITGAAHLCTGFHSKVYRVDIHARGKKFAHEALVQTGNAVSIWRDTDRDHKNDGKEPIQKGYFGINIHRASALKELDKIGYYSAGCQVVRSVDDFLELMEIVKQSENYLEYGPRARFSYMLFDISEV